MRRFVVSAIALLFIAACTPEAPAPEVTVVEDPAPAAAPQEPANNPEFPAGIEPGFAYRIRSRSVEGSDGDRVRRLVIEFKATTDEAVDAQIEDSLTALGYRRYKTFEQNGSLVGDYGNTDGHRVTVTTTAANGQLELAPDSVGTVYFVWKE